MSESKIDLIAKLLAKAESTTPEEAEALTAAAERLMVKYAIDQAVIDERRAREGKAHEQIITVRVVFDGTYKRDLVSLGSAVVRALGSMRALSSTEDRTMTLHIVGFESDVAQAELLIRSLHIQALVANRQWWNSVRNDYPYSYATNAEKARARHSFVAAFGQGAAERITANRQHAVEEAGTGTELVLVSRKARVDAHIDANYRIRVNNRSRTVDSHAYGHGRTAGRNANTGERAVSMGRGLPAGRS